MTVTRTRRKRLSVWHRKKRYAIRQNKHMDRTYRVGVAVVGTVMILIGAVMVPLPTPGFGWVMIFLGLGVLSTEFAWAHRVTHFVRRCYDAVAHWFARQSWASKTGMIGATVVIVLAGTWAIGLVGIVAGWVHIDASWLAGPMRG